MKIARFLLTDDKHLLAVQRDNDHQKAIDYFNSFDLPDNALIVWEWDILEGGVCYQANIPDEETKLKMPHGMDCMLWKEFKGQEDNSNDESI